MRSDVDPQFKVIATDQVFARVEIAPKGLDRYRMKPFSINSSSSLHVPLTLEADSEDEHLYYRQGQPFHKGGH